ncbi:MAG TPA: hypothetical protein VM680_09560 [Verrucomicrobiae bacterium]|nr:hypothetical protein [Verrucomicrobiae bacterium]
MTTQAKRISLVFGLLFAALLVCAMVGAYMISRDVPFDFERPDVNEANSFRKKLRFYEAAKTNNQNGFVRFSQLEINSYISRTMTNIVETNSSPLHLRRVAVALNGTNLTLYSWGEYRKVLPLKFVVQREFRIQQEGTNLWEMPLVSFKIGEVEVPENYWTRMTEFLEPLDNPVKERYGWATNVPAILVRKNELSSKPELRLYTYKPIPPEDRR